MNGSITVSGTSGLQKYSFCVLLLSCIGFGVLSGNVGVLVRLACALFLLFFNNKTRTGKIQIEKGKSLILFVFFLFRLWTYRDSNIFGLMIPFIDTFCLYVIFLINYKSISSLTNTFVTCLTWISLVSLIAWILFLFDIVIWPPRPLNYLGIYDFLDYGFFYKNELTFSLRFQSLFVEPGAYGILCVFAIILNGLKRDYKTLVFVSAIIFTISLAAYVLLITVFLYNSMVIRKRFISILVILAVIFGIFYIGLNYNGGDNVIYDSIFWRLAEKEDGTNALDERSSDEVYAYYNRMSLSEKVVGIGGQKYQQKRFESSVDLKSYILRDGYIGLFLFVTLFVLLTIQNKSKARKERILLLLIYALVFYRGFVFAINLGAIMLYYFMNNRQLLVEKDNYSSNGKNVVYSSSK